MTVLVPLAAAAWIARATSAGCVTSGGMKIAMTLSTSGSAATALMVRSNSPGVAEAIMSTGFVTLAAAGRKVRSRAWVSAESGRT